MNRKEIQSNRMKNYFIEATKEIIRSEGVEELRVKKIADLAGYAPSTLYNYYEDLNELLFYVGIEFFADCKEYVLERIDASKGLKEKIISTTKAYSSYFIENPKVFKLLFLYDLKLPDRVMEEGYMPEIAKLTANDLDEYAKEGFMNANSIDTVLSLLSNSIHGTLLFYINKRGRGQRKEEIIKKIEEEARYVLDK